MTENADSIIAKLKKTGFADMVPASTRQAFFSISEQQGEQAKLGLERYMAHDMPKGSAPLTANIITTRGKDGSISVECHLEGMMDSPEFQRNEARLTDALSCHPAFDKHAAALHCEHQHGKVCLTAAVVGLNVQDYVELLNTLAEHQHAQETAENNGGIHREESEHTHDKMIAAAKNLKQLVSMEMKGDHPEFDIKCEKHKCKKKPGHYQLDIRIANISDPKPERMMGALARAFNRKRRGGMVMSNMDGEHVHHDYSICDTHLTLDELTPHGFDHLLSTLSRPNIHSFRHLVQTQERNAANGVDVGGPQ